MRRKSSIEVRGDLFRLAFFTVIAVVVLILLAVQLSGARFTSETGYRAVFADASELRTGDEVKVAGVRVGTVDKLSVGAEGAVVQFSVDKSLPLTQATQATVRYKDLLGNRFLQLSQSGSGPPLPAGGTIPKSSTFPALDLDALLGGFQPLFEGLQPDQINQLSQELVMVLQGEGGTVDDLLGHIGSVTNTLADREQVIGNVITNLNSVLRTVSQNGDRFSQTLTELQQLLSGLAADRTVIGQSIDRVGTLAGSVTQLLDQARPSIQGTVDQFNRTVQALDKNGSDLAFYLQQLPQFYSQFRDAGSYGSFTNLYLCALRVKVSGPDGKPIYTPWIRSNSGVQNCGGNQP